MAEYETYVIEANKAEIQETIIRFPEHSEREILVASKEELELLWKDRIKQVLKTVKTVKPITRKEKEHGTEKTKRDFDWRRSHTDSQRPLNRSS